VPKTWADVDDLFNYINFQPQVGYKRGIKGFVDWYKDYFLRADKSAPVLKG
jgi:UDP-glucuronate 4-epimerase